MTATHEPQVIVRSYSGAAQADRIGGMPIAVSENNRPIGLLRRHALHSPTGMNWGFIGSGPRELARALLIDAAGETAVCATCEGVGRASDNEQCPSCRGGYTITRNEEAGFEAAVVARLGDSWVLTRDDVLSWLMNFRQRRHVSPAG